MADLLSRPGFRVFWLANLGSNLGTSAFVLAINWLTVKQYGAAGIASLALAYGLPQMLLQLVGGTVSDRIDRRRLFGLTQAGLLLMAASIQFYARWRRLRAEAAALTLEGGGGGSAS